MQLAVRSRYAAFGLHLLISALIFGAVFTAARLIWFPGALFEATKTWEGIRILVMVDVVLGPVLTLIVFNPNRKPMREIARDLTIIAVLQLAGLLGGLVVVYGERPAVASFQMDTWEVFTPAQVREASVSDAQLGAFGSRRPLVVETELPESRTDAALAVTANTIAAGRSYGLRADLWRPFPQELDAVQHALRFAGDVDPMPGCAGFTMRMRSKRSQGRVCFDPQTQRFLKYVED